MVVATVTHMMTISAIASETRAEPELRESYSGREEADPQQQQEPTYETTVGGVRDRQYRNRMGGGHRQDEERCEQAPDAESGNGGDRSRDDGGGSNEPR